MDYPATVRETRRVANVAVFTAMIVGSNLALSGVPNVKFDGAIIFLVTLLFGVVTGGSVALLSELIWSQASPWGPSGTYLLPFLLSAELLYVLAGWTTRVILKGGVEGLPASGILYGGMLGIFTFMWDVWTNLGTALLTTNGSLGIMLTTIFGPQALPFAVVHELSNLFLGLSLVPVTLVLIPRLARGVIPITVE